MESEWSSEKQTLPSDQPINDL